MDLNDSNEFEDRLRYCRTHPQDIFHGLLLRLIQIGARRWHPLLKSHKHEQKGGKVFCVYSRDLQSLFYCRLSVSGSDFVITLMFDLAATESSTQNTRCQVQATDIKIQQQSNVQMTSMQSKCLLSDSRIFSSWLAWGVKEFLFAVPAGWLTVDK